MKLPYFLSLLALSSAALAAPAPEARVIGGSTENFLTIAIEIVDGGKPVDGARFLLARSAAAQSSGKNLRIHMLKDGQDAVPVRPTAIVIPEQDGWAAVINVDLPPPADKDAAYRIELRPSGNTSALTYEAGGHTYTEAGPLMLEAGSVDPTDLPYLTRRGVLRSSLELGGGEDGALLSLRLRAGQRLLEGHDYARWMLQIDADLSPSDEARDSLIYGRVQGELDALWRVPFPAGGYFNGSAFYGVAATFKSDQDFDNWDATVGLTAVWYVNCALIDGLGRALHLTPDDKVLPHPLAFGLKANYVYASEREAANTDLDDFQVAANLTWLNRIYSGGQLPFMSARFNVNLLLEASAVWELESADVHPKTRVSLEFEPDKKDDANLAFALTWAKGQFSPTFVDEDAFLAGLKLRL
jgi:hypothetical protein